MNNSPINIIEDFPFVEIHLNDQDKNLLTISIMQELIRVLSDYEKDERCNVVILTGTGEYFCFGGNLGNRFEQTSESILDFANALTKLHETIMQFSKITIAAINGIVGGGGVSLVDACDFAVASQNASFEFPELHHGLAPMISFMGVRNSIPKKLCYEMLMAKKVYANQLVSIGLVNEIAQTEDIVEAAKEYWNRIPDCSLQAVSLCKQYYVQTQGLDYHMQLEIGKHYLVSMLKGE